MTTSGRETLGQRIKRIRDMKQMSLLDIERNCDGAVSNGYISRVENGHETNLTRDKVLALAQGLGVPVSSLLEVMYDYNIPVNADEDELVGLFRQMNEYAKRLMLVIGRAMAKDGSFLSPSKISGGVKRSDTKAKR
jgi:transcriptional regulator with XRE-family HTH domain